jgi:RNA polymerase sigma factor (sigma-70 family)
MSALDAGMVPKLLLGGMSFVHRPSVFNLTGFATIFGAYQCGRREIRPERAQVGGSLVVQGARHDSAVAARVEDTVAAEDHSGPAGASRSDDHGTRFRGTMIPHLDAAYNLARFLSRDSDAAQDIVQDAYLRAFRSFSSYRGGNPRAWILAIVRNCHHTSLAERRRAAIIEPLADDSRSVGDDNSSERHDLPGDEATPETDLLKRSEAEEVRSTLESLPAAFREVLILRELEEFSYREIAEVAAIPIGTVMSRLARARRLFEAAWRSRAGSEDPA